MSKSTMTISASTPPPMYISPPFDRPDRYSTRPPAETSRLRLGTTGMRRARGVERRTEGSTPCRHVVSRRGRSGVVSTST